MSGREKGNEMYEPITEETKYLITDGWEIFRFAESKQEATELAKDEAQDGSEIGIYELKKVGSAYIPDPGVIVEWD